MNFKEFKIEARYNHTKFYVLVKFLGLWVSGYMWTNYFSVSYDSEEEAKTAIENYLNQFTLVS